MITAFRRYLETWVVRGFYLNMVASFVIWGVGDVVRSDRRLRHPASPAVDSIAIEGQRNSRTTYQSATLPRPHASYQQGRNRRRRCASDHRGRPGQRGCMQLIAAAAVDREIKRLGIVSPDAAVRQAVFATPAFRGANGQFDRAGFRGADCAMSRHDATTGLSRHGSGCASGATDQMLEAVSAGDSAPTVLLNALFEAEYEK